MKTFDVCNYVNSIKNIEFPKQNEFANAKGWEKNIVGGKDATRSYNVPDITLGKKYYIDWTKLFLDLYSSDDKKKVETCNAIKNSGIGEVIFNEIIFERHFAIILKGKCCTTLGVSNFKLTLPYRNTAEIEFEEWRGKYYFKTDIYTDKTLQKKVYSDGKVVLFEVISYYRLASAILRYSFNYNVCDVCGKNVITNCKWDGVSAVAVKPRVVSEECGFSITKDGKFRVYGYHMLTHEIEDYENVFAPYSSYEECVNKNKIKFTCFDDFEEDNKNPITKSSVSVTIIINGEVKFVDNNEELNKLIGLL